MKYIYLIYDGRYYSEPNRAIILSVADSYKEAKQYKKLFFDSVVVRCQEDGKKLINPEIISLK